MCVLGGSGLFVSYDDQALRLWSLAKQTKCIHHSPTDSNLKFIALHPIDAIDVVLVFYSVKGKASQGGLIRVFSAATLTLLQEVRYPSISYLLYL
jgi:hypothetical protein